MNTRLRIFPKKKSRNQDLKKVHQTDSNPGPHDHQPNAVTTRLPTAAAESTENLSYLCTQLINVYVALTLTVILVEGVNCLTLRVQFYVNECKEGETLIPNTNECNSTLTSGTCGGAAPTYTIYTGEGGQLPNPKSAILH